MKLPLHILLGILFCCSGLLFVSNNRYFVDSAVSDFLLTDPSSYYAYDFHEVYFSLFDQTGNFFVVGGQTQYNRNIVIVYRATDRVTASTNAVSSLSFSGSSIRFFEAIIDSQNRYMYITTATGAIWMVDISVLQNMRLVSQLSVGGSSFSMKNMFFDLYEEHLIIGCYNYFPNNVILKIRVPSGTRSTTTSTTSPPTTTTTSTTQISSTSTTTSSPTTTTTTSATSSPTTTTTTTTNSPSSSPSPMWLVDILNLTNLDNHSNFRYHNKTYYESRYREQLIFGGVANRAKTFGFFSLSIQGAPYGCGPNLLSSYCYPFYSGYRNSGVVKINLLTFEREEAVAFGSSFSYYEKHSMVIVHDESMLLVANRYYDMQSTLAPSSGARIMKIYLTSRPMVSSSLMSTMREATTPFYTSHASIYSIFLGLQIHPTLNYLYFVSCATYRSHNNREPAVFWRVRIRENVINPYATDIEKIQIPYDGGLNIDFQHSSIAPNGKYILFSGARHLTNQYRIPVKRFCLSKNVCDSIGISKYVASSSSSSSQGLSGGSIAGIVIGAISGVIIIIAAIYYWSKSFSSNNNTSTLASSSANNNTSTSNQVTSSNLLTPQGTINPNASLKQRIAALQNMNNTSSSSTSTTSTSTHKFTGGSYISNWLTAQDALKNKNSNDNNSAAASSSSSQQHYHRRGRRHSHSYFPDYSVGATTALWKTDPSNSTPTLTFSAIPSGSHIYQQIQNSFSSTISNRAWIGQGHDARKRGQSYSDFKIVAVHHVENTKMWQQYVKKRESIAQKSQKSGTTHPKLYPVVRGFEWCSQMMEMRTDVNECLLYHGSSKVACDAIAENDFNSAFTNPNSLFGKASAYLSENSNKSDEYSEPPDSNDSHWMLLCRVTLGTPHIAKTALHRIEQAPCISSGHSVAGPCNLASDSCQSCGGNLCDSVIGVPHVTDVSNGHGVMLKKHREFCVYDPDQIYVEFLVEYKRV